MRKAILIILAVLIGVGLYIYLDPKLNRAVQQQIRTLSPDSGKTTPLYKWRDQQGHWQITDQPPPAGVPFETLQYDSDTNVIPSEQLTGQKPKS